MCVPDDRDRNSELRWNSPVADPSVVVCVQLAHLAPVPFRSPLFVQLLQGDLIDGAATSVVALMNKDLELEFLASRITFFQGSHR